ncbi:hypothetical protein Gotur_026780 [Gossypium turneri]
MLLKYEQESKQITVLLTNLSFPNGVALNKDGSFLVFAETTKCRILRYWLSTPKAGNLETLAQLPGFPDNIKRSPRGGFWVAIHSRRCKVLSWILSYSKLGNALIWVLPVDVITKAYSVMSKYLGSGLALRISEEGVVLETLELESGNKMSSISEVQEKDDHLWMGSINMPFLGVYSMGIIPQEDHSFDLHALELEIDIDVSEKIRIHSLVWKATIVKVAKINPLKNVINF